MSNKGMDGQSLMYFGKHNGTQLKRIPDDYLEWLLDQKWIKEDRHKRLYAYLKYEEDGIRANVNRYRNCDATESDIY